MRLLRPSLWLSLWLVLLISATLLAPSILAAEIDEAVGLDESPPSAPLTTSTFTSGLAVRHYGVFGYTLSSFSSSSDTGSFPNLEYGITILDRDPNAISPFADATYTYTQHNNTHLATLNQIGLRFRISEHIGVALGKERNRRSPGILFSPSDFVFSQSSLPGQREDRTGAWLLRASHQQQGHSVDLLALPVDSETNVGFPANGSGYKGTVVRNLLQWNGMDLAGSFGVVSGQSKAGLSVQGYPTPILKLYYDGAMGTDSGFNQHLVGLSLEPNDGYILRAEFLAHNSTTPLLPGLTGTQFTLLSLSVPEFLDQWNLFGTAISDWDTRRHLSVARIEYLIGSNATTGVSWLKRWNAAAIPNAPLSQITIETTITL